MSEPDNKPKAETECKHPCVARILIVHGEFEYTCHICGESWLGVA